MSTLDHFRSETRAWLENHCPPGARGPGTIPLGSTTIPLDNDTRLWLTRMAERGWTVPTWPKAYGGAELDRDQYQVLIEELKRVGARTPLTGRGRELYRPHHFGIWHRSTKSQVVAALRTRRRRVGHGVFRTRRRL